MQKEARDTLRYLEGLVEGGQYVTPLAQAHVHASLGETDLALQWLEVACDSRSHFTIWLGNLPWTFEELHAEPRFQKLMDRMDFPRLR